MQALPAWQSQIGSLTQLRFASKQKRIDLKINAFPFRLLWSSLHVGAQTMQLSVLLPDVHPRAPQGLRRSLP